MIASGSNRGRSTPDAAPFDDQGRKLLPLSLSALYPLRLFTLLGRKARKDAEAGHLLRRRSSGPPLHRSQLGGSPASSLRRIAPSPTFVRSRRGERRPKRSRTYVRRDRFSSPDVGTESQIASPRRGPRGPLSLPFLLPVSSLLRFTCATRPS